LLKREFPGDQEFTYSRYWELPYVYIINAVKNANELRHKELHENEIPLALLACQQAEINRDRKKQKKPYEISDFYCYEVPGEQDTIDAIYSSATKQLIDLNQFPRWALFIYKDLMKNAGKAKAPNVLAYCNEHAIIIAPRVNDGICKGLVIALEYASHRVLSFDMITSDLREVDYIRIRMPKIEGKVAAIENCVMDILS
jgi:hypothetical protein